MTQYSTLNLKLSNSQLNKLNLEQKLEPSNFAVLYFQTNPKIYI